MLWLLLFLLLRKPLADAFWPDAQAEVLRQHAEAALARGRLSAGDGSGARELYEAALAIDPDRTEARAGLARVAQAAVAQARTAAEHGRFADAHRQLMLASSLSAPRAQTEAVAEILRRREVAVAGIDGMLIAAAAARRDGRLDGARDAALPLYRNILSLQPQRIEALEGREDALTDLLQQARADLNRGALANAAAAIAAAVQYDAGHVDLAEAQALQSKVAERLRYRADADLRAERLERAAEGYREWQRSGLDPDSATRALQQVAWAYLHRARAAIEDFHFAEAERDIASAESLAGDLPELREVRHLLQQAQQRERSAMARPPTAAQMRRVHALLSEAVLAEKRGDWLTPPGDSAYDKLRAARALAPGNPQVLRASANVLPHAKACFQRELRDNRLQRARVCLDACLALEGDTEAVMQARRMLAQRWLAIGDERLGRSEIDGARTALDAARTLDAKTPGLSEFAARVHAASEASPQQR